MTIKETNVAFDGHGRFMNNESAIATRSGVDERKMMKVSTCDGENANAIDVTLEFTDEDMME